MKPLIWIEQECDDHPADRNLYALIISSLSGIKINESQDEDSIGNIQADEGKEYPEGKIAFVLHKKRERNPKLIKEANCLLESMVAYSVRHVSLTSKRLMGIGESTSLKDIIRNWFQK